MPVEGFLSVSQERPVLTVQGSLIVYRDDDLVEVKRCDTEKSAPEILLLQVSVTEGVLPMKGITRRWFYREVGAHVRRYARIIVHGPEDEIESVTVQVSEPTI